MKQHSSRRFRHSTKAAALALAVFGLGAVAPSPAAAVDFGDPSGDYSAHLGGWVRNWTGFNLDKDPASRYDKWWDPAMVRNELLVDADAKTGPVKWKFIGRFDKEIETDYLHRLHKLNTAQSPNGLVGSDYMSQYNTTRFSQAAREAYADFDVGSRVNFRVGRQQLVWGESDFFHAMDIISGFDLRSRLFFENNEEYRKTLFMVHGTVAAPEVNGNFDFFVRPGIDPDESIGNSYNIEGGRWIPTPYQGVDFTSFTGYNYHHKEGDKSDPTFGTRWKGQVGDVGYSLAYIRTFNPDPVMNPTTSATTAAFGVTGQQFYKEAPENTTLGDWIYPMTHNIGVSGNYYIAGIDSVISGEGVFTPKRPYNHGALQSSLPGWAGIKEKDTMVTMLRLDKNLSLENLLGTNRPSLASFQMFDTWITGFKQSDEIVEFASFAHQKHEHSTMLTAFVLLNYFGDTVNPSFVVGVDASNGGGFAIPAIELAFGDNWRVKAEADLFWDSAHKSPSARNANGTHTNLLGIAENQTSLFGWFHGADQFVIRTTRLF
jgi:hypothetical protein